MSILLTSKRLEIDGWFEGKWIQLEDIMLSEVSQTQKDKGRMFSLIFGK
jgi:hypothetical protein